MPKAPETIQAKYRQVFLKTALGRDVLSDILVLCHFGGSLDPDNKVQVSEYNVGIAILHRCGVFAEDTFEQVIRALANVVPKLKSEG